MPYFNIQDILISCIAALIILPIHEWAHAYTAHKLGDNTAYYSGRMTMNPLAHLDPIGFICLVVAGFGWAKPVPVNPLNFKNSQKGMAITAAAGPISTFILAYLVLIVYKLFYYLVGGAAAIMTNTALWAVGQILAAIVSISVGLGVFNLIPIPPLDGSKIIAPLLPRRWIYYLDRYQMYISLGLMILLISGALSYPLSYVRSWVLDGLYFLSGFVDMIFMAF